MNVMVGAKDKEGAEDGSFDNTTVGYADGVLLWRLVGDMDSVLVGTDDSLGELDGYVGSKQNSFLSSNSNSPPRNWNSPFTNNS